MTQEILDSLKAEWAYFLSLLDGDHSRAKLADLIRERRESAQPTKTKSEFEIGEQVVTEAGEPVMTVASESADGKLWCEWFKGEGGIEMVKAIFDPAHLRRYTPPQDTATLLAKIADLQKQLHGEPSLPPQPAPEDTASHAGPDASEPEQDPTGIRLHPRRTRPGRTRREGQDRESPSELPPQGT